MKKVWNPSSYCPSCSSDHRRCTTSSKSRQSKKTSDAFLFLCLILFQSPEMHIFDENEVLNKGIGRLVGSLSQVQTLNKTWTESGTFWTATYKLRPDGHTTVQVIQDSNIIPNCHATVQVIPDSHIIPNCHSTVQLIPYLRNIPDGRNTV